MDGFLDRWKNDYDFKTVVAASISLAVTIAFAIYNGVLGVLHSSLWHGSICTYYIVLVILRTIIISSNSFVHLLRTISFIEALVAILTLQNTLIMVNIKGESPEMLTLSAITSAAIMLIVLGLSVATMINGIRRFDKSDRKC